MLFLILTLFGIFFGFIIYKVRIRSYQLGWFVGILPYSLIFLFSDYNKDFWIPYKGSIIIITIIACIVCMFVEKKYVKHVK